MLWTVNSLGVTMTKALYLNGTPADATYDAVAAPTATIAGFAGATIDNEATVTGVAAGVLAASNKETQQATILQNACLTSVVPYSLLWTTAFTTEPAYVTAGFIMSTNNCLDYVTDEFNISGTQTLTQWDLNQLRTVSAPATQINAEVDNTNLWIWRYDPTVAPLD